MDNNKSGMKVVMSNEKTRNLFFITVGFVVIALGVGVYSMNKNSGAIQGNSKFNTVPSIEAGAGESSSKKYNELRTEQNKEEAADALKKGETYVPVVTNDKAFNTQSPLDNIQNKDGKIEASSSEPRLRNIPEEIKPVVEKAPEPIVEKAPEPIVVEPTPVPQVVRPVAQEVKITKAKYTEQDMLLLKGIMGKITADGSYVETDYTGKRQAEMQAQQAQMQAQAQQTGQFNNNFPGATTESQTSASQQNFTTLAKSGTVMNAVLETGINSDEPSPVLAKIVSGKLKGGKLLGQMNRVGQKVVVQFNTLSLPDMNSSLAINAVAIDADTRRSALASEVDNHYFQKYGILLAATFIKGYAEAVASQNTTTQVSPLGGVTVTTPPLNQKQINQKAIGEVGKELADQTKASINPNPTVKVNPGTAVGILFMSDLKIENK